jgi:hypothetical protein
LKQVDFRKKKKEGKGKAQKEEVKDRVCMICMSGEVEDEQHFVLSCTAYQNFRNKLFEQIEEVSAGKLRLGDLSREEQWKSLMKGNHLIEQKQLLECLKTFLVSANNRRKANLK